MRKIISGIFIILVSLNIAVANPTASQTPPAIVVEDVIIPMAPPAAPVMVAYMKLQNRSKKKQTITHVSSPQFKRVEIHSMTMENGMMNMQQLKSLSIQAKKTVVLESGGLHLMLIKPLKHLKEGTNVELTFKLISGELTTINTKVQRND